MALRRIFTLAFWLTATSMFGAEPKWFHVSSADFEIFSSASEGDTRRVLQHFERVRSFFITAASANDKHQGEPVRVIVFGSKKDYEPYRLNSFAAAFYRQIAGRDYIVLGGAGDDVFPIAVHEYVHLVVRHAGLNLPPWLNEGMAELYSTLKPQGDKVIVGNLIAGRMLEMQQQKWVPLTTILSAGVDSPYYNEKSKAGSLYDEGWALTHMLQRSPEYSPRFTDLVLRISNGTPSEQAIESVYGKPLAAIEKELQAYLRRDTFSGRVFSVQLTAGAKAAIEPAQMFDVELALLDLSDRPGKEAETRQKLTDLAAEYPQRPEPQSALGYLSWRMGQQEQAVKAFAAAFELGGRNPQMLWDYGRLAANSDRSGAVRALAALLESQPNRLDVRLLLAGLQLRQRQSKEALETLAPVKSVTPADAPRLFELLAFAKAENGDITGARADAERWMSNAKNAEDRQQAQRFIDSLNAAAGTAARTPEAPAPSLPDAPDGSPPELTRSGPLTSGNQSGRLRPVWPSVTGNFEELDCSSHVPKLVLQTSAGKLVFLLDQPDKVSISGSSTGSIDLTCGRQKSLLVTVKYDPAVTSQAGVKGAIRAIQFEPENQKR